MTTKELHALAAKAIVDPFTAARILLGCTAKKYTKARVLAAAAELNIHVPPSTP